MDQDAQYRFLAEGKILIADDEEGIRLSLSGRAIRLGLEVVSASDGIEAIQALKENELDLACVETTMPGKTGFEVIEAAQEIRPELRLIVITASESIDDAVRALRARVTDYLLKPISTLVLFDMAVLHALKRSAVKREHERLLEESKRLDVIDLLTGLYNRRKVNQALSYQVERARRDGRSLSLADLIVLVPAGSMMSTTLAEPDGGYDELKLSANEVSKLEPAISKELGLNHRTYQAYFTPLVVRHREVGVLSVVLPSNFILSTEAVSRNTISLIFTLGTFSIIGVGCFLAKSIGGPLIRLRDVALAVASGDLDQRTGLDGRGKVGQLTVVLDLMTYRLRKRTAQAARLYEETVERNKKLAQANTRLQMAQQQLIQSEKLAAVGQLTAGVVHDVKNPLAVFAGLTEELEEEIGGKPGVDEQLRLMRKSAFRASSIVSDLLKFARQSDPELLHQELCSTVKTSLRLTDYLARKGNMKVQTHFDAPEVIANYDATQIEQVLINLIQNAIQAMPDGGTLNVGVRNKGEWAEVHVQDTGAGISEDALGRIFDPFFTTKPEGEGTGLGLSVSYGIIKQHKGDIDVESTVGKGTKFTIKLPRNPQSTDGQHRGNGATVGAGGQKQ